jgi:hypothetical protein
MQEPSTVTSKMGGTSTNYEISLALKQISVGFEVKKFWHCQLSDNTNCKERLCLCQTSYDIILMHVKSSHPTNGFVGVLSHQLF